MNNLNLLSFALDVILVMAAILAYWSRPRIGGELAKGLRVLLIGVMILGLAHFIETGLFALFNLEVHINEIVHRLIVMAGFVFVILGFFIMHRAFDR